MRATLAGSVLIWILLEHKTLSGWIRQTLREAALKP